MAQTFKESIDKADPNSLADLVRKTKLGSWWKSLVARLWKKVPAASPYQLATVHAIALPDDAKASVVKRAYSRAATAGTGELTIVAYGATPATGQIAVAPNGDLAVLAADAHLLVDVEYDPTGGDVKEYTLPVAADTLTLPTTITGTLLMEAEALVGTSVGKKIVLVPGAGAPAAGQARLNVAKTAITFAAADAVTSARVKVLQAPETDTTALLGTDATF